jgi:hypothetical protein
MFGDIDWQRGFSFANQKAKNHTEREIESGTLGCTTANGGCNHCSFFYVKCMKEERSENKQFRTGLEGDN